jgi:hypothetical protein
MMLFDVGGLTVFANTATKLAIRDAAIHVSAGESNLHY